MKLPFYYNFAELQQDYKLNLSEYLMYYPDATEQDFAQDYMSQYRRFFLYHNVFNFRIPVKKMDEGTAEGTSEGSAEGTSDDFGELFGQVFGETDKVTETSLFYLDYMEIVESRVREHIMDPNTADEPSGFDSEFFPIFDVEYYDATDSDYSIYHKHDGYILDRETFDIYKELMTIEEERFPNKKFMVISPDRFNSFRFSMIKIYNFLDDIVNGATGSKSQEAVGAETAMSRNLAAQQYTDTTIKIVTEVFGGNFEPVELLKYLSDNFTSASRLFTDLTKYNHIYRYMKSDYGVLEQSGYKDLVLELFGFDYGNKTIKGETPVHLKKLEKLTSLYRESNR